MTRKLLPYEHELIKALGVTEQDYLDFLAAQHDFTRSPEEKLQELRAEPVSITLAVVGILFSVASTFLAPKPELPESPKAQQRRRDQVFAPRFGFNSQQELAKYGDPVNLIYCNTSDNPTGGVRAGSSLVWSSVHSYGSSQFMQMLLAIGAGQIAQISADRIAFGQTPMRQFITQKTWAYFNGNGAVSFNNLISGDGSDPSRIGIGGGDFAYQINLHGNQRAQGFSQAFSPSTLNRCGIYAPIPINVDVEDRKDNGKQRRTDLGITVSGLSAYWPGFSAAKVRPTVPVGHRFTMTFARINPGNRSEAVQAAQEQRRTLLSSIDGASIYKLGSAQFRVVGQISGTDLQDGAITVTFECIQAGKCPQEDYNTKTYQDNEAEAQNALSVLNARRAELEGLLAQNGGAGPPIFRSGEGNRIAHLEGLVNAINDGIEDLRAIRDGEQQLRDLEENAYNDPIVNKLIREIDDLQERLEEARERKNQRKNITRFKQQILKKENQLKRAVIQFGLQNGKDRGGRNINQTIKNQKRQLVRYQRELSELAPSSAYWDTAAMNARNAQWRAELNAIYPEIANYEEDLARPEELNDYFNTKCLVKVEEASYTTITNCRVIDFALKARVFKRVQGRADQYGEVKMKAYKDSDNGIKLRSMFFWLWYRRAGSGPWQRVSQVFVVRRGADIDNYINLKFIAADNTGNWEFRFDAIAETAAEMREFGLADFAYIENSGDPQFISLPGGHGVSFLGSVRGRVDIYQAPLNNNPAFLDEWGLFSLRSDTQLSFSFDQGPELSITAVTEQRQDAFSNYPGLYSNLSMLGFNAYSGQGIQDLRSVSVFVSQGKLVRRLRDDGTYPANPDGASSYAPDIFLDTILDGSNGIGKYAKVGGIDLPALALAKSFCRTNGLYFDGVIAEQVPWRQFWAEVAPFSLLELGRVGGRETLVPAVPCNNAGQITRQVPITALFNQGNILEDSYREEFLDFGSNVQDLIASVIYRDTERDGVFPRNRSVDVCRSDVIEANAVRQTFDLSQYVTNRNQAILFAKLLCNQRRHVRRAIEFSTFPTDSVLEPGSYIYVAIGQNQWDQVSTGVVEAGGVLNTPIGQVPNGSGQRALVYQSGSSVVTVDNVTVSNGTAAALAPYAGRLFVLGTTITRKRVFRVTEVQMDEEGEVSVKAIEHPCIESGSQTLSLIADFADNLFTVR